MSVPTPHNSALLGDIAKTVLMPGDPLRAKLLVETYLKDPVCYNQVRGMLGFTGSYNGKPVSVQGSGMGMPSMGIYSHELFSFYGVDTIIRIGSAGAIDPSLKIGDIVVAVSSCTTSSYGAQYHLPGSFAPTADFDLARRAVELCEQKGFRHKAGTVLCSDWFYDESQGLPEWQKMGVLAVEMESAALFTVASTLNVRCGASFHVIWNQERKAAGLLEADDHDTEKAVSVAVEALRLMIEADRAERS